MRYNYAKVDAFTSNNSLGNPAACFYLNKDEILSDEEMLRIAKEHNNFVSEVVFCKRKENDSFDLTYFSKECEVMFCGHGTIACMHNYIKQNKEFYDKEEILLHTRKNGDLILYNDIKKSNNVYISAPKPQYLNHTLTKEEIAMALEINASDISDEHQIELIDVGNRTLIVPISDFNNEISIFPNEQKLKEFTLKKGIDIILIYNLDSKKAFAHTRVFAAKYGYLEDPATGSGNSAFGYYMLNNKMWEGKMISLEQGGNDRIYNTVFLKLEKNILLFGENSTLKIEGKYFI